METLPGGSARRPLGAWVPGQADNLLRGSDTAKRLRIPLIYLLECAGVELDKQEKVYPNRRGGGTPFYRNSELRSSSTFSLLAFTALPTTGIFWKYRGME